MPASAAPAINTFFDFVMFRIASNSVEFEPQLPFQVVRLPKTPLNVWLFSVRTSTGSVASPGWLREPSGSIDQFRCQHNRQPAALSCGTLRQQLAPSQPRGWPGIDPPRDSPPSSGAGETA